MWVKSSALAMLLAGGDASERLRAESLAGQRMGLPARTSSPSFDGDGSPAWFPGRRARRGLAEELAKLERR